MDRPKTFEEVVDALLLLEQQVKIIEGHSLQAEQYASLSYDHAEKALEIVRSVKEMVTEVLKQASDVEDVTEKFQKEMKDLETLVNYLRTDIRNGKK